MADLIGDIVVYGGMLGLVIGLIVLSFPWRRNFQFRVERVIDAPREKVWDSYRNDPGNADWAAFHQDTVSVDSVDGDPALQDIVVDSSGGHGTHLVTVRSRTLAEARPESYETRIEAIDGKDFPFGAEHAETLELLPHPDGTAAGLDWQGETRSLWQYLGVRRAVRGYMDRLKRYCETGEVVAKAQAGRKSLRNSLILSALAIGSFAIWLGWIGALVLTGILVVHEFGHWLAMRLTGQPAPRMILIPFFGGVAVANHPHKSQFDDAFCSLMGAGFSLLLCLALLLAATFLGAPDMGVFTAEAAPELAEPAFTTREVMATVAVGLTVLVALLNLLQLLPFLPLDGGHVLRSILQSFSAKWARWVALGLAGLGAAGFGYVGYYILAGFMGLGALQAWHMGAEATESRPMGVGEVALVGLGYGMIIVAYASAMVYGVRLFGVPYV